MAKENAMTDFISEYASVAWVTLAYLGVYYAILLYGLFTKRRVARACKADGERFDRYNNQSPELLAADRMQLNTLEHMPPFLVLLWLQACIVSAYSATLLGTIYVLIGLPTRSFSDANFVVISRCESCSIRLRAMVFLL